MILDTKLAALLKSSDLMCEGRCRPSLKSDSHSAAVVAALVSLQFSRLPRPARLQLAAAARVSC